MTTGEIVFMAGAALLVLTVILAIVFLMRKPQYRPELESYAGPNSGTQPLRSGYATDTLALRRGIPQIVEDQATEILPVSGAVQDPTETMLLEAGSPGQETEKLDQ